MSSDRDGNPAIEFSAIEPGMVVRIVFTYFDDAIADGVGSTIEHTTRVRTKGTTTLTTWEGHETPIETGWSEPCGGSVTYYLISDAPGDEPALGSSVQGATGAVWQRLGTDPAVSTWGKTGDAITHDWAWIKTNEAPLVPLTQVVGP